METNKIIQGDCLTVLKSLPAGSVDCVITSPPYWGLRDYGTGEWQGGSLDCDHKSRQPAYSDKALAKSTIFPAGSTGHALEGYKDKCGKCGATRVDKQLGLEATFTEYVLKLCDIFDEIKRVLKDTGTCWVNIGDTYAAGGGKASEQSFIRGTGKTQDHPDNPAKSKLRHSMGKSLLQIPARFSIEMSNRGWLLRNEIIWHKPNCMPASVKDRFTVDYEKIFFFVKKKQYYFNQQKEKALWGHDRRAGKGRIHYEGGKRTGQAGAGQENFVSIKQERNVRCIWKVSTSTFKGAHFATYPEKLLEPMINAGCPVGGVVLDPFIGAGTTAVVARRLGREYLGIELNPEYIEIINKRLSKPETQKLDIHF